MAKPRKKRTRMSGGKEAAKLSKAFAKHSGMKMTVREKGDVNSAW